MLKDLLAGPNCTVTESKFLVDAVTGDEREVDVVAEYDDDGHIFVQSFEVTGRKKPADLTWAEQLIKKHENLPTAHLCLVPWGGAYKSVQKLVTANPRVSVVTPEIVEGRDGPEIKTLFADMVRLQPMEVVATVERPNGERGKAILEHDFVVCSADGTELGGAGELYGEILNSEASIQMVLRQAHDHPQREELKSFVLGRDYSAFGFYLRKDEPVVELQHILSIEVTGGVVFEQTPLEMEIRKFGEQRFAHGRTSLLGTDGLVVATLDDQLDVTKMSAKFGANKGSKAQPKDVEAS